MNKLQRRKRAYIKETCDSFYTTQKARRKKKGLCFPLGFFKYWVDINQTYKTVGRRPSMFANIQMEVGTTGNIMMRGIGSGRGHRDLQGKLQN